MKVPNGWQRVPIKEVYEGLYDGPHATPPTATEGPVFLGIGNITEDGHLDLSAVRHIAEDDFARWTKRVTPQTDDIVFTYEATLNRYAVIPRGFRGCLGRRLALIRPDRRRVDAHFLHYYFFSQDWRETIAGNVLAGATVDRIPLTRFPTFPINLPPLVLQRRIARILTAYDDLIENNTRRIAILEEMARRLYEEWFVRFRFPGSEGEFTEGDLPQGWTEVRLDAIAAVNPDTISPRSVPDDIHYIDISSVSPGRIDQVQLMPFAAAPSRARRKIRTADILWSCVRPNRRSHALVLDPLPNTVASTGFAVLRAMGVPHSYLYSAVRTDKFVDYLVNHATGAAYPAVKQSDFEAAKITLPNRELLRRFDALVDPLLRLSHALDRKNANLRTQRDLLLPKLISGEIDVSAISDDLLKAAE